MSMPRAIVVLVFSLVLLLALDTTTRAAGFLLVEQSSIAGGTGGAGTARSSDPAAAWYNPAALASGSGLRASAGLLVVVPSLGAHALDGSWEATTDGGPRLPPHLYLSYSRGPWAAGLAFNVPFGSGVIWPETWRGRYEIVLSSLQVFRLAPFFAWRLGRVRVGAGMHADVANLQIKRRLDFVDQEGRIALDLNDAGFGGHASIFVDILPGLVLGASYKSRTRLTLAGSARFDVPLSFSAKAHDQQATAEFTLPDLITLGGAYRPHPRWSVVLDLGITIWSVYQRLLVDFEDDATTDTEQINRWQSTLSVRTGAEVEVLPWLAARAGLLYDPSPVPEHTLAPNSPDSDRLGFTLGLGAALPWGLTIDAFYCYTHLLGQPSKNDENLRAEYDGRLQLFGVGVGKKI